MPAIAAVAALYFARDIFIPLALAILLSFALEPLVMLLQRWHFGRVASVIAAVLLAFVVIFGVAAANAAIGGPVPFGTPFTILCALTLMSLVVGPFAAAAALRQGME